MTLLSRVSTLLLLSLTASVASVACSAETASDDGEPASSDETDEQDVKAKVIGEESNGKTVDVQLGRSFTIALAENPTTGYRWRVKSVDRTIGQPKDVYTPGGQPGQVGSGGTHKFTWKTNSPLNLVGKHKIDFELQRPWSETAPPAKTFSVTIDIKDTAPTAPKCGGLAGLRCAAGSYCEFTATQRCGMADQMGTCEVQPQMCTAQYDPVCGCNGKTYSNGCAANAAGTSVASKGACKP